jgi:hypothetical protein
MKAKANESNMYAVFDLYNFQIYATQTHTMMSNAFHLSIFLILSGIV